MSSAYKKRKLAQFANPNSPNYHPVNITQPKYAASKIYSLLDWIYDALSFLPFVARMQAKRKTNKFVKVQQRAQMRTAQSTSSIAAFQTTMRDASLKARKF